ncbi:phosphate signaling complex protein PhoU [Olsenella urininfantis]|uniref:phosphate signaling complex protein PhoU n=1 Tax=Olsenella urininfantis TaxID=1871033 RepID=UPI0009859D8F|nr:phosphate signaling complex protein PhoU [Olsenella urininfantis]
MATRSAYTKELNKLAGHVTAMGQAVVENVCATGRAMAGAGTEPASEVIAGHRATSLLGRGVEDACMSLMLLQQPLARDLRLVTAAFRAVSDLARIEEMAYQIALTVEEGAPAATSVVGRDLGELARRVATMVARAMDAFDSEDVEAAEGVFAMDDGIDGLYDEVRQRIVDQIKSDGEFAPSAPELLTIAKYYERMGDHAQSIADWAIFRSTGSYRGHSMGDAYE